MKLDTKCAERPGPDQYSEISRRSFVLGTVAVAGAVSLAREAAAGPANASAGYWAGSDQYITADAAVLAGAPEMVVSASGVTPDRSFLASRGGTIRIHGLFGPSLPAGTLRLDAVALYAASTSNAPPTPVYAWSLKPAAVSQCSPSALFAMPMDAGKGIILQFDLVNSVTASSSSVTFTAQATGVYFVAVNPSSTVSWPSTVFTAQTGIIRSVYQRTLSGMQNPVFPYIMVTVAPLNVASPPTY